jgi:hypothetical protein
VEDQNQSGEELVCVHEARPRRDEINLSGVFLMITQNRNFLLCWKAELSILP